MIEHNKPTIGKEEEAAAIRVLQSHWLSQGREVELFENEFCKFLGLPDGHVVALSNGTSALFLSLLVLKAKGKKIAFPSYVCSALRNAVSMVGGNERLVDTDKNSPNIDIKSINENDNIGIIPHMYGIPVDFSEIKKTHVIEDCAQALGAKINKKYVGLHGKIGIFSFYATKIITSGGQGGMLVSKDKSLVDAVRDYREFDYRMDKKNRFNFQMTDLQAAIGREQLKKLPYFLSRREEIFQKYKKSGIDLLDIRKEDANLEPVRYRAIMITKDPKKVIESLKKAEIKAIIPTEDWEILGRPQLFQNALKLSQQTVSLPIYPSLSNEDIDIILSNIKRD